MTNDSPWIVGRTWGSILSDIDDRSNHADSAKLASEFELNRLRATFVRICRLTQLQDYLTQWLVVIGEERDRRALPGIEGPSEEP